MRSVLIIDDEPIDCMIFSRLIEKLHLSETVISFNYALDAINYLKSLLITNSAELPTHLFVDINMPVMNGFQFLEELAKMPEILALGVKVYVLSSSRFPKDKNKAESLGIVKEFIIKPITTAVAERILKGLKIAKDPPIRNVNLIFFENKTLKMGILNMLVQ